MLEDQVIALHDTAGLHTDLDLGRVGIRGWSSSGTQAAAFAYLDRPAMRQRFLVLESGDERDQRRRGA